MSDRLKGKVALVSAAGQGIGRAIAEAFIAEGAKVIATDLAVDKLKGLKAAKCVKLDVLVFKKRRRICQRSRQGIRRTRHSHQCCGLRAPGHGA